MILLTTFAQQVVPFRRGLSLLWQKPVRENCWHSIGPQFLFPVGFQDQRLKLIGSEMELEHHNITLKTQVATGNNISKALLYHTRKCHN